MFFFNIFLAILGLLYLYINFRISLSVKRKKTARVWLGLFLLWIDLGETLNFLTTLNLPTHIIVTCFHLLGILKFLSTIFYSLQCMGLAHLSLVLPSICLYDTKIPLSFYMLIWNLAVLLKLFISLITDTFPCSWSNISCRFFHLSPSFVLAVDF